MDKCPKCGSPEDLGMIQDWSCGSIKEEDESITESETCLRRQLAAANEKIASQQKSLDTWLRASHAQIDKYDRCESALAAANERAGRLEETMERLIVWANDSVDMKYGTLSADMVRKMCEKALEVHDVM